MNEEPLAAPSDNRMNNEPIAPVSPQFVQAPETNSLAIVGLVLAILFFPAGLIISIVAFVKSRKTNGGGGGLAIAGMIVSGVNMLACVGLYFLVVSFFSGFFSSFEPIKLNLNAEDRKIELAKHVDELCDSYVSKMDYYIGGGEGERHGQADVGLCDDSWTVNTFTAHGIFASPDSYKFEQSTNDFNDDSLLNRAFPNGIYSGEIISDDKTATTYYPDVFLPESALLDLPSLQSSLKMLDDSRAAGSMGSLTLVFFNEAIDVQSDSAKAYYLSRGTAGSSMGYYEAAEEMGFSSTSMYDVYLYSADATVSLQDYFAKYLNENALYRCKDAKDLGRSGVPRTLCEVVGETAD